MESIEEQLVEIFGDETKVAAGPNTRNILESDVPLGLVRRAGAIKMRAPERLHENVEILGVKIPHAGSLWDVYERTF